MKKTIKKMTEQFPNDQELGREIRKFLNSDKYDKNDSDKNRKNIVKLWKDIKNKHK